MGCKVLDILIRIISRSIYLESAEDEQKGSSNVEFQIYANEE